jgi:LPS sulfotransferase NodH
MKRSKLIPMLVIFDAPDGTVGVGDRPSTTVAPQALLMMNNPQVRAWAKAFGKRVETATAEESVRKAYRIALSREVKSDELAEGTAFVKQQAALYNGKANAKELALADYCQVVMCLSEMMYVE